MRQWIYQYPFINEKNWGSRVGLLRPTARQSGFFLSGFCSLQIHFILVNNSRSLGSHFILCYFSFRKPKCPRISTANHGPSIKEVWRIQFIPPPPPKKNFVLWKKLQIQMKSPTPPNPFLGFFSASIIFFQKTCTWDLITSLHFGSLFIGSFRFSINVIICFFFSPLPQQK